MVGVIEMRIKRGTSYPQYKTKPANLPVKTKMVGAFVMIFGVATCTAALVGFYFTYFNRLVCNNNTLTDIVLFIIPPCLVWVPITFVILTYDACFRAQNVICCMPKSNKFYAFLILFYIPWIVAMIPDCHIMIDALRSTTFGMCSLFIFWSLATFLYAKKNCQCKRCKGLKEVRIQIDDAYKLIDETTRFDQKDLIEWFDPVSILYCQIYTEIETGEIIVHHFTRNSGKIQLEEGHYYIRGFRLVNIGKQGII